MPTLVPLDPGATLDTAPAASSGSGDAAASTVTSPPASSAAPASPKIVPLAPDATLDTAPASAPAAPAPAETIGQRAGSFATGANDLLARLAGAPVDLATAAINRTPDFLNWLSFGALPATSPIPKITDPVGGSQQIRQAIAGTVGRTDPQDALDRVLYGTGGAVMSVPLMGMGGALLADPAPASAALAPAGDALAQAARGFLTPATGPALARTTALAAGSGAGGGAAREEIANVTNNPWALAGADLAGSVLGGLAAGGALAVPRVATQLLAPLSGDGQQTIAGRLLNQAVGDSGTPNGGLVTLLANRPQPAGVAPTLGDLTANRGLQSVQRAVEANPDVAARGAAIASQNNQQILNAFDQVGQPGNRAPYEISQQGAQQLEAIRADQQQKASGAFQAVDPSGQAMVPTAPLLDRYDNYVTGLSAARRRFLPDTYDNLLTSYEPQEPLQELQDFRTTLQTEARQAGSGPNPDYNRANVLNGLHDALFPQGGPEELLSPQQGSIAAALQSARDQWQDYAQTYNQPPAIKAVLQPGGTTQDSDAFAKMLGPGAGQSERAAQFVRAAQGDPDLLQNARDWFTAKMQQAGSVAAQDQQGSQMLNGNQLRLFHQNNQPLIDSPLFNDQHRQAIGDIVDAANMVQSTARAGTAGGSDTVRNLASGKFLQPMGMGPLASAIATVPRLAGGAAGMALGHEFFGLPGALIGGPVGTEVGSRILNYEPARANVQNLIAQAVHDPTLAGSLMSRPAAMTPPARGFTLQELLAGAMGAAAGQ